MSTRFKPTVRVAVASICAAALFATLSGCVVAPADPYYGGEAIVNVAPPAPRYEYVGPAPVVGQVWIGGYWNWVGSRHEWVGGHWDSPPHYGYHWIPHSWSPYHGGWVMHRGHWDR